MKYIIRGNKVEITDAIKEYIESKLSKLDKYLEDAEEIEAKVMVSIRGTEQKIEVTINAKELFIRAEVSHSDLYAATDLVLDKLERQIRRYKDRIVTNKRTNLIPEEDYEEEYEEDEIVRRKEVYLKPMDEDEAIMQMELLGHTFFVFKNVATDKICVVYKRKDDNYGIIETN